MHVSTFIRVLRRVESNYNLFVCRHQKQASMWGVHPLCWQVWDREPTTGKPYPVRPLATRDGLPRDPSDLDFRMIANGRIENICQGRSSWDDAVASMAPREHDAYLQRRFEEWQDMAKHEGWPRALRMLGHHKVFGVEKLNATPRHDRRRARKAERSRRKGLG